MKARIRIGHFGKGQDQGTTMCVGIFTMEVKETVEQVLIYRGCMSPEISKDKLKTVTIHNRVFVVRDPPTWNIDACDYDVYLPFELATNLRKVQCACCGNSVIDPN